MARKTGVGGPGRGFRLDFAPHLGFPTPATPLFAQLAGDSTPEAQIAFAAARGFRRVQDPFAASRSEDEQRAVAAAAKAAGIGLGCFVYAPMERAVQPWWTAANAASREVLDADLDAAIALGQRLGSRHIAVLTGNDPARFFDDQCDAFAGNLARLADRVAAAGMMLCLEAVNAQRLPMMLLHRLADAERVVRAVNHPGVRLIFDTAHVQAMDGDILGNLDRVWDLVELIQLADHPGRVEPGAGELNFTTIIDEIERRGFSGPVELEHGWSVATADRQEAYLQWLGRWTSEGQKDDR